MDYLKESELSFNKALDFARLIYKDDHSLVIKIQQHLQKFNKLSIKEYYKE